MTNRFDGTISRIDPDRGEVVKAIPVGLDPRGIAVGFGDVWVALAGSNQVVRVDPDTNAVTQPISVGNAPGSLAVSADAVWVVNTLDDTVSRISPDTNSVVDTIPVGDGPSGIAVVHGAVWVTNEADGTLSRIEPGQTSAGTMVIGSVPQGLAGVGGNLWVSVRGTATSHRGGTLRLVSLDPPKRSTQGSPTTISPWRLLHLHRGRTGRVRADRWDQLHARTRPGRRRTDADRRRSNVPLRVAQGIRYSNGEVVAARRLPQRPRTRVSAQRVKARTSSAGSSGARPARTSPNV